MIPTRPSTPANALPLAIAAIMMLSGCATPALSSSAPAPAKPASGLAATPPTTAAPKPGSLMDATLNKTKFPESTLTTADKISFVGRPLRIEGAGYAPGAPIDLVWGTMVGSFKLGEQMEFSTHQFVERNVPIASVKADDRGRIAHDYVVPEDYGGVHNIYAVSGGEKVMQAGVTIRTEYFISPLSGPTGTPISVRITGIGYAKWEESRSISYDNQWVGIMNGILTRGTAVATIRAAGGPGKHVVRVSSGAMEPYMNVQQSPNYFPGRVQDYLFMVTPGELDSKGYEPQTEWVDRDYGPWIGAPDIVGPKGERLVVSPNAAPVGTPLKISASGFAPNTEIDLQWEAMRGNRNSGWSAQAFPIEKITVDGNGKLEREVKMPDDLGGGHALLAVVGGKQVAGARVIIEPSFFEMTPRSGPAGTELRIVLKGVGWTEVDNVYVMTYDNAITGYACGFNSAGDVTIVMTASGEPGWHYIDFWPSVYLGGIQPPWVPNVPWLSFRNHPGLPKPAFHLAFKVTG